MRVVRLMVGEAERPPSEYTSFEFCQMAALVQITRLNDVDGLLTKFERMDGGLVAVLGLPAVAGFDQDGFREKLQHRLRLKVVALLERARDLATEKDNPADVADNLLRLVYFYQLSGQPYHAAILGEHIARRGGG